MTCETCYETSCNCVCSICKCHEPKFSTPKKVTRRRKKSQINWICCSVCETWVHPRCSGLTQKETKLLQNNSISEQFFKCLHCILKTARQSGVSYSLQLNNTDSATQTQTHIDKNNTKVYTAESAPPTVDKQLLNKSTSTFTPLKENKSTQVS